jgi:hypothetical protein
LSGKAYFRIIHTLPWRVSVFVVIAASASLINEMTAQLAPDSAQFCRIQGLAKMGRRIGNCLSGFAGPVLFGLNPQAPFLLAAGSVLSWALFILYLLSIQQ